MTEVTDAAKKRRDKLLEIAYAELGKNRAGLGRDPVLHKETVPLNIMDVDSILGGGIRRGRMAMVVGHESMGKTLFTQWVIRAFQEAGDVCGFIDPEKTYEAPWFERTGVQVDDLIVAQPPSTEAAFDLAIQWATNGMGLIVVDSLAALVPKARSASDLDNQEFMGLAARKTNEALTTFMNANVDSTLVCTNQLRTKLGVVYGSPDTIPGGKAQMYAASYILRISRKEFIKEGDVKVGYHMKVHTLKNKLAPPLQDAIVPFMYTGLIDTIGGTIDLAVDLGLLVGHRGRYTWNDESIHGRAKLADMFRANLEEFEKLKDLVKYGESKSPDDSTFTPSEDAEVEWES